MTALSTDHWAYLTIPPKGRGQFKAEPEDFIVIEDLGYELTGDGEHIFVFIEKRNLNTAFVAEQLASFTGLPLRNITYAGRKDKYGVCRQWFGIHAPGVKSFPWEACTIEGVNIIKVARHNKKLRTGQLKGNTFIIRLRHVENIEDITAKLDIAGQQGVPNYFGEQRFGVQRLGDDGELRKGGNLALAERMINGETIKNRNKRSMALSALRSWLFNEVISQRIASSHFDNIMLGDAIGLTGSNSFFSNDGSDTDLASRYQQGDVCPTAPLWGKGKAATTSDAHAFEDSVTSQYSEVLACLENAGLKQERRQIRLWPRGLAYQVQEQDLVVSFNLPSGCFATSVLRECVVTYEKSSSGDTNETSA